MKLIRNIILSFILMFTMTSCEDWFYIDHIGKPVEFGITTRKSIKTRTIYSGIENGKEILQWSNNDKVTIWMYWDRDADEYCETTTDPVTYQVKYKENRQEKSYGSLVSLGESLRWQPDRNGDECIHEFYSIYPANKTAVNGNIATFSIPNRQSGVDMSLAYMTAHRRVKIEDNGTVELEYYPRVTTLYIAVVNDTDETINNGEIKLTSSDSPIAGDYTVSIPNYSDVELEGTNDGWEITNSIKTLAKNESDIVAFFIRPRNYDSGELSLTFNGKTQSLNKALKPNYKYNIQITVSGNKPPTFKETIGNGEAQFLILWLSNYLNNDNFNSFFGYSWGNDHDYNGFQNKFINGGGWDSATIAEDFLKFFTDEQLDKLYNELLKQTIFKTSNKQITYPISGNFFRLFPSLEEIYIQTYSTIEVFNLEKLRSATFEYASEVTITGCDVLTSIMLKNTPNLEKFTLSNCKSVTTFDMTTPSETWTPNTEYTFDNMEKLSSVKLCSAKAVNVYDCSLLPDTNISMKNPVSINRTRK